MTDAQRYHPQWHCSAQLHAHGLAVAGVHANP